MHKNRSSRAGFSGRQLPTCCTFYLRRDHLTASLLQATCQRQRPNLPLASEKTAEVLQHYGTGLWVARTPLASTIPDGAPADENKIQMIGDLEIEERLQARPKPASGCDRL